MITLNTTLNSLHTKYVMCFIISWATLLVRGQHSKHISNHHLHVKFYWHTNSSSTQPVFNSWQRILPSLCYYLPMVTLSNLYAILSVTAWITLTIFSVLRALILWTVWLTTKYNIHFVWQPLDITTMYEKAMTCLNSCKSMTLKFHTQTIYTSYVCYWVNEVVLKKSLQPFVK